MKRKHIFGLTVAALLVAACVTAVVLESCSTKRESHSLDTYTNLIGCPIEDVEKSLGISNVNFMGVSFSLNLLTEPEFENSFAGIELSTQLNNPDGKVADTVWNLVQAIDDEYLSAECSHENVYSTEIFTLLTEREYHENLETALRKRGAYVFDISWRLSRFATDESDKLLYKMERRVLEELEDDGDTDLVWSVDSRLDLTLQVTIWDENKADVTVLCRALAEPAAGLDMDLGRSERSKKILTDAYRQLLQEEYLSVVGYGFRTVDGNISKTLEDIHLHGDDFVYIIDNGISKKIYLQVDGIQYKTVYRNGEYGPWEKLAETIEHPLPWIDTDVETVFASGYGAGLSGNRSENVYCGSFSVEYAGIQAEFMTKANNIYRAEYRTVEEKLIGVGNVITENKRVLEITVVTEQEAKTVIEKYKAMLP